MSTERLKKLEDTVEDLHESIKTLTLNMTSMASSVNTMSDAVTKLAVIDEKFKNLTNDVKMIADSLRSHTAKTDQQVITTYDKIDRGNKELHEKINKHHENHEEPCNIKSATLSEGFYKKLLYFFSGAVTVSVFLFWLNHDAIQDIHKYKEKHLKEMSILKQSATESTITMKLIREELKKANAHRYYLNKDGKN